MITAQNRLAAANIATSNLKSGTDFSIAAIMARDELSRESSEYSISKAIIDFIYWTTWNFSWFSLRNEHFTVVTWTKLFRA